MLEEKYKEYTVLEEQRLLKELLGVQSEEEVYEIIKNDMLEFDEYVETHTQEFLDNQSAAFLAYNTVFNQFMADYKKNLEELAELKRQELELMNLGNYIGLNDNALSGVANNNIGATIRGQGKQTTVTHKDGTSETAYIINGVTYDEYGNRFDFQEGDVVRTGGGDYEWQYNDKTGGYEGVLIKGPASSGPRSSGTQSVAPGLKETVVTAADGTKKVAYINSQNQTVNADGSAYAFENGDTVTTGGGNYTLTVENGVVTDFTHTPNYSRGIKGGPVTYTGLAMLHGSSSKPEYVLNSDQAYNLLRYMATTKPDFISNSTDAGTQYVLNGDVILNEVENAAEFWNEVTMAMDRRISVTKNNR